MRIQYQGFTGTKKVKSLWDRIVAMGKQQRENSRLQRDPPSKDTSQHLHESCQSWGKNHSKRLEVTVPNAHKELRKGPVPAS